MLKLIVVLGGAILMALEMVGSRVLAPQFGSSIFVWGSLISIFLTALSVGNYWGGWLADKSPRLSLLGGLVAAAGFMIWALPFYAPGVTQWIAQVDLGPRLSPLVASVILFAVPSLFLGTISPYAIRLEVQSVETVGNTAGRLYALSTVGSIVGTLVASFVLIPTIGVRTTLHGLGITLLLLALATFVSESARRPQAAGGAASPGARPKGGSKGGARSKGARAKQAASSPQIRLLAGMAAIAVIAYASQFSAATEGVLYEKDGLYHKIIVRDRGDVRHLHFDNTYQSAMYLSDPDELVFFYTRYLHLAKVFAPQAERALFLGLGGGSIQKSFHRDYPDLVMDVAELDPDVVSVARRFFDVAEDERLRIHTVDGRLFLKKTDVLYDLAILDAYSYESIPFHLTTREFLEELAQKLTPDGVVAANIIGAITGRQSRLFRSMIRTYQDVFPQVYIFPVGLFGGRGDPALRNIIVIATKSEERLSRAQLLERANELLSQGAMRHDVRPYIQSLLLEDVPTGDVPLLTDDYAPVDSLQHF